MNFLGLPATCRDRYDFFPPMNGRIIRLQKNQPVGLILHKFEITELEAKSNILTYQVPNFLSQQTKYIFI